MYMKKAAACEGRGFNILESRHAYEQCWQQKEETGYNQEKDEFPDEFKPFFIRYLCYRQDCKENTGTWCDHVCKTVSELESEDCRLSGETYQI